MLSRTWRFDAVPECVAGARHAVTEYAVAHSVPEPPLEDLRLAVSEAVTNAVVHAFRHGNPGTITIDVAIEDGTATVSVTDDGVGIGPRPDSPGLGMGLPLMSTLADAIEVGKAAAGNGTAVRMRFGWAG